MAFWASAAWGVCVCVYSASTAQKILGHPNSFDIQGGGGFMWGLSPQEISRRSLKKAWEISRTTSGVIQCMAWWTQKRMVYFANCANRVEPPQVPLTMQGRPIYHTLPVMRV